MMTNLYNFAINSLKYTPEYFKAVVSKLARTNNFDMIEGLALVEMLYADPDFQHKAAFMKKMLKMTKIIGEFEEPISEMANNMKCLICSKTGGEFVICGHPVHEECTLENGNCQMCNTYGKKMMTEDKIYGYFCLGCKTCECDCGVRCSGPCNLQLVSYSFEKHHVVGNIYERKIINSTATLEGIEPSEIQEFKKEFTQ
jgi:hypothetical protein